MTDRKKNGVIAIISGIVMAGSGIVAVVVPVDPTWLPIAVSIISAITGVIFGTKVVKG